MSCTYGICGGLIREVSRGGLSIVRMIQLAPSRSHPGIVAVHPSANERNVAR